MDTQTCFEFWCIELTRAYRNCYGLISYLQRKPGAELRYFHFSLIYDDWKNKLEKHSRLTRRIKPMFPDEGLPSKDTARRAAPRT